MLSSRKKAFRLPQDLRADPLWPDIKQYVGSSAMKPPGVDLALSPCQTKLAYASTSNGASRIVVYNLETCDVERVSGKVDSPGKLQWLADSRRMLFLAAGDADGLPQILQWDIEQDSFSPLTEIAGVIEDFHVSPDGAFALVRAASPNSELSGVEGSGRVGKTGNGVESWMPSVHPEPGHAPERSVVCVDLASADKNLFWIPSNWNIWDAVWCGAGRILAVVSLGADESDWYSAKLVYIDRLNGDMTIIADGERQFGCIAASASGQRIAYVEALGSDRYIVAGAVYVAAADATSRVADPIDTLETDVSFLKWQSEDTLLFAGLRGLRTVVGTWDAGTRTARELWSTDETCGSWLPSVEAGKTVVALTHHSYNRVPEICLLADGALTKIATQEHSALTSAGTIQELRWQARDGVEIEGLLCLPEGKGPHPLVALVHGGPVFAFRNSWVMQYGWTPLLVQHGYAVLHPNPRGSLGRGTAFLEMIIGDMGGEDAHDITRGIDQLARDGVIDNRRVAIMGRSYGGFMAAWLITQTDRFAAAIAMAPVTNWINQHFNSNIGVFDELFLGSRPFADATYIERSPLRHVSDRCTTPILIIAGSEDRCTPPAQSIEFHQALAEAGCTSQLIIYPGEGHHARSAESKTDLLTRILLWLRVHLSASTREDQFYEH